MTKVAILGYGVVGSGVAQLIHNCQALIEARRGAGLSVKSILDIRDFPDDPFAEIFVKDFKLIEDDPEVTIVVEAIGGVRHAYDFTKRALLAKKHVVTSNKELVATHGAELLALARTNMVHYLFEAAVGGGIPLIYPITQCLSVNHITEVAGILNGTSNYILTRMRDNGFTFEEALLEAQKLGYAESDPTDDVQGHDTSRKMCILASMLSGRCVHPDQVETEGIACVKPEHLEEAASAGCSIKLVGRIRQGKSGPPSVYVAPHMVKRGHPLHSTDDVFNGVLLGCDMTGDVFLYGRGAGKLPTASSVLSDIIACLCSSDPLGGLGWEDIPVTVAIPPAAKDGPHHIFADGTVMRVLPCP
jgi:homoserine dehydrogenase